MFVALAASFLVPACSDSEGEALVEYPPLAPDAAIVTDSGSSIIDAPSDVGDATVPVGGKKIANGVVLLEGATSDRALVYEEDSDLKIWPEDATAPVVLLEDFRYGEDVMQIHGRVVGVWLGEELVASSPKVWANTGGLQTIAAEIDRESFVARPSSDDFVYLTPGSSFLRRDVWATKAGGGAGAKIVTGLDIGYPNEQCRSTIAYTAGGDLVVAGCTGGVTTPKVAVYTTSGPPASTTILDNAAPGVFFNRARTHALVQTTTASSIRSLSGLGSPVALDVPVASAGFSADDTKVVYRLANGRLKRAATTSPASPVELLTGVTRVLGLSMDARFIVVATTDDGPEDGSNIVIADANTPGTGRTLVADQGTYVGMAKSGTRAVYLDGSSVPAGQLWPDLYVVDLPGGTPVKVATGATRVEFANDVVYWLELDAAKKATLKAARISAPSPTVTIDEGLDLLSTSLMVVGTRLFAGSKLGLWEYPALTP